MHQNEIDMKSDEIRVAVMALLREAGQDEIEPVLSSHLGALGLDSLKLVEIIFALETRFAVVADEELMAELNTVGDLVDMIQQACATRHAGTV